MDIESNQILVIQLIFEHVFPHFILSLFNSFVPIPQNTTHYFKNESLLHYELNLILS